jgi:cytochrome c oxidase assembly protein subunit 15
MALPTPSSPVRVAFRLAALFTFLSVLMGAVVCATESGFDCPSWPGCYPDRITPIGDINPWIEFTHRTVAILTGPILLAAAILGQRSPAVPGWIKAAQWLALAGGAAAAVFGMLIVLRGIPTWLGVVDLAAALTAMIATGIAAVAVSVEAPARRLGAFPAWSAVGALLAYHLSGIVVAGPASLARCLSWPVWRIVDLDGAAGPQLLRLLLAATAAVLLVVAAARALRQPGQHGWGIAVLALLVAVLAAGVAIGAAGLPPEDRYEGAGLAVAALYAGLSVALLRAAVELAIRGTWRALS